jgi:1-phosphatidylinositol-3-phosphate 5-kinase
MMMPPPLRCSLFSHRRFYLSHRSSSTEYMSKAYYHNLPTVMCKILGVYTVRFDNKDTGRKAVENVVVMENIFYQVSRAALHVMFCDLQPWCGVA